LKRHEGGSQAVTREQPSSAKERGEGEGPFKVRGQEERRRREKGEEPEERHKCSTLFEEKA